MLANEFASGNVGAILIANEFAPTCVRAILIAITTIKSENRNDR